MSIQSIPTAPQPHIITNDEELRIHLVRNGRVGAPPLPHEEKLRLVSEAMKEVSRVLVRRAKSNSLEGLYTELCNWLKRRKYGKRLGTLAADSLVQHLLRIWLIRVRAIKHGLYGAGLTELWQKEPHSTATVKFLSQTYELTLGELTRIDEFLTEEMELPAYRTTSLQDLIWDKNPGDKQEQDSPPGI